MKEINRYETRICKECTKTNRQTHKQTNKVKLFKQLQEEDGGKRRSHFILQLKYSLQKSKEWTIIYTRFIPTKGVCKDITKEIRYLAKHK